MGVPSPMIELNKSYSALCQTARYQTIVGETGLAWFRAITCVDRAWLLANVHRIGCVHLHAERHLVLSDSCYGLGISECGIRLLINFINRVEHPAPQWTAHTFRIV